jgi:hypothetical protein
VTRPKELGEKAKEAGEKAYDATKKGAAVAVDATREDRQRGGQEGRRRRQQSFGKPEAEAALRLTRALRPIAF